MQMLKALRKTKKLSQGQLARMVGCSQFHLSAIERGFRRPNLELALRLGRVLGVDTALLFSEKE